MKSVSNAFKLSCDNDVIDSDFLVYVSKGKGGNVLCTLDNTDFIIQTMRLRGSSTSEQTISIGGVCSTEFTITLTKNGVDKLQSNNSLKKNYCLHVVQWNKVDDGNQSSESPIYNVDGSLNTSGRCDLGYYYISKIKNSDYDCEITAYDGMIRFDKAIGAKVLKHMKKNKKTISEWLDYFCTKLNNSYFSFSYSVSSNTVNSNLEVCISDDSEIDTYRQALGYLSALACGFATFTNSGDLIIQTYNTDISVESINDKRLYDYDFDSYVSKVTSFSSSVAGFDFSLDYTGDKGSSEEIDIEVSENPFLRGLQKYDSDTLDSRIDTALTNIATSILGVCFYGCNVNVVQRPYLDLGDMVDVQRVVVNDDGSLSNINTTNIIVCSYDYAFCSSMSVTSSGATGTSTSSSSGKLSSSPKEKPSSTDSRVDELINATTLTKKVKKRVPVDFTMETRRYMYPLLLGEFENVSSSYLHVVYNINHRPKLNDTVSPFRYINDVDSPKDIKGPLLGLGKTVLYNLKIDGIGIKSYIDSLIENGYISSYDEINCIIDNNTFTEVDNIITSHNDVKAAVDETFDFDERVRYSVADPAGTSNTIKRDFFGRLLYDDGFGNIVHLDNAELIYDFKFDTHHKRYIEAWMDYDRSNSDGWEYDNRLRSSTSNLNIVSSGITLSDFPYNSEEGLKINSYADENSMIIKFSEMAQYFERGMDCIRTNNTAYLSGRYKYVYHTLNDKFPEEEKTYNAEFSIANNVVDYTDIELDAEGDDPRTHLDYDRLTSFDELFTVSGSPLVYLEYEIEEEYEKTTSGVAKKLNDVSDKADKNESDIKSIKSDLASTKSSVSALKSTVKSLKNKVNSLNNSVSSMKHDITTINSELSGIIAKDYDTQLSSINTSIREINNSIESINTSLSETDTLLSSLNTSVSNQSVTISNLNGVVSSQAETIAELTSKITDLEDEIGNIKPSSSVNVLTFSNKNNVSVGTSDVEVLSCDIDAIAGTKLLLNLSFVGNFNLNDVLSIKLVIDGVESSFVPKFQVFSGYCGYSISKSVLTTSSSGKSNLTIFASLLNSSGSFSSENFEVNILKSSSGSAPQYKPNLEYSEDVGLVSVGVSEHINIQGIDASINISVI